MAKVDNRINFNSLAIQITTIRLNGDNFLHWLRSVRLYIRGQGTISYITREKTVQKLDNPFFATWNDENSMVMTWVVNSMVEDIN